MPRFVSAALALLILGGGCGGSSGEARPGAAPLLPTKERPPLVFVGFDASGPLVDALKAGKLQGLVVQNPYKMGDLGVRTVVAQLEKKPIEPKIATGETLVTPENMDEPEVAALLHPPKAPNRTEGSLSGAKAKAWRVMVIPKGTTHEFWMTIHAGAEKAAKELGNVELIWQGPQKEDDRIQQIQLVQSAVASGVDGIVLAPLDAKALVKPVEEAIGKGIAVVIIDSDLESEKIASYVATDNYHGGVLAARRMGERLQGAGDILVLRYMVGSASTEKREQGFLDTIAKEFPKVKVVSETEYAGATSDSAQQKSQSLVTRYRGQVNGVFCPNESSTFGMLRALEGAGMLTRGK